MWCECRKTISYFILIFFGLTQSRKGAKVFYPRPEYCTDNAAMVACLGAARLEAGDREDLTIKAHPRWSMEDLKVPGLAAC